MRNELPLEEEPDKLYTQTALDRAKRRESLKLPDGSVAPFPRKRFLEFVAALRILSRDYGMVPLRLLGTQTYVLDEIEKGLAEGITTFVILKGRQLGISTIFLALDLFWAFDNAGTGGVFATHDEGSRDQFRNQIDLFIASLPAKYKIGVKTNNRIMMVLKNLSLFRYLVAGTRTTTNKLGRSGGCSYCHATETAFWGSEDDIKALGQTFSETNPKRMYFYESTANGFNHYYDMWETASDSPAQKAIFVGWWRDERNEFDEKHPLYLKYMPEGTKTPLTTLERMRIKAVKDAYDFQINAGQVAWYRFHLQTKCGDDQQTMDQEMPWTADDAFQATGKSFIKNEILTSSFKQAKKSLCLPFIIKVTDKFSDTQLQQCAVERADLKIWQKPSQYGRYVIGADPIYGSSPDRDNGVISVFRCYADGCEQVAEYASSTVTTLQFAWVLGFIAGLYKDVYLILEMNGPGTPVYQELGQLKQKLAGIPVSEDNDLKNCLLHMKNFLFRRPDSLGSGILLQWQTTPRYREQMLHKLNIGIESGRCQIKSLMCLEEAKHMRVEDDGYIGAPPSKRDDRIFGAGMAYWGWDENVRRTMLANKQTKDTVMQKELTGTNDPVQGLVNRYLKNARIDVPQ